MSSQKPNTYVPNFQDTFTTKIVLMKKIYKYINMILWLDNWKFEIGFLLEHVLRKVQQNYNKSSIFWLTRRTFHEVV